MSTKVIDLEQLIVGGEKRYKEGKKSIELEDGNQTSKQVPSAPSRRRGGVNTDSE